MEGVAQRNRVVLPGGVIPFFLSMNLLPGLRYATSTLAFAPGAVHRQRVPRHAPHARLGRFRARDDARCGVGSPETPCSWQSSEESVERSEIKAPRRRRPRPSWLRMQEANVDFHEVLTQAVLAGDKSRRRSRKGSGMPPPARVTPAATSSTRPHICKARAGGRRDERWPVPTRIARARRALKSERIPLRGPPDDRRPFERRHGLFREIWVPMT